MASGQVSCTGCDFRGYLQYRPITLIYRFNDGAEVQSHGSMGWCDDCNNIRDIESTVDQKSLLIRLAALQAEVGSWSFLIGNAFGKLMGGTDQAKQEIVEIQGQLRLAQNQGNRTRCLTCGGEHTHPIAFNRQGVWQDFKHGCGEHLKLDPFDPEAPRFSYRSETIYLDQDGLRI